MKTSFKIFYRLHLSLSDWEKKIANTPDKVKILDAEITESGKAKVVGVIATTIQTNLRRNHIVD